MRTMAVIMRSVMPAYQTRPDPPTNTRRVDCGPARSTPLTRSGDERHANMHYRHRSVAGAVGGCMGELLRARLVVPTGRSAHIDTYVRSNLPPPVDWPRLDYSHLPTLAAYPAQINAAVELLDCHVHEGHGAQPAIWFEGESLTYSDLLGWANRLARVLTEDLGVVPGNRVLLRGFNSPS